MCRIVCLLAAVGGGHDGATFHFEQVEGQNVMVFTFPKDFRQRAKRKQGRQSLWKSIETLAWVGFKVLKIVTAFGLILSLLILCVAAIAGLIAAIVALSRGGNGHGHQRSALMRQMRSVFFTIRQLLWCYALFGSDGEGQDPFLREIAYDMYLVSSLCCGGFGNPFLLIRAHQISRRRQRIYRGWGSRTIASDVEGVSLIRQGSWGDDEPGNSHSAVDAQHRGLLSVAVEYLFGPTPFYPGPSTSETNKLRAAALVHWLVSQPGMGASIQQLAPYTDRPPADFSDEQRILEEGLIIVAHFNGVPNKQASTEDFRFDFPELESESSVALNYSPPNDEQYDGGFVSLLYKKEAISRLSSDSKELPRYLKERHYVLTRLTSSQFLHCSVLGGLNLLGVIWLSQTTSRGGVIEVDSNSGLGVTLHKLLLPVLTFYAVLFFAMPLSRFGVILGLNKLLSRRNQRRECLARQLEERQE